MALQVRKPKEQYSKHLHRFGIKTKAFPYQEEAIDTIVDKQLSPFGLFSGGILADDPGTGKTLMMLGAISVADGLEAEAMAEAKAEAKAKRRAERKAVKEARRAERKAAREKRRAERHARREARMAAEKADEEARMEVFLDEFKQSESIKDQSEIEQDDDDDVPRRKTDKESRKRKLSDDQDKEHKSKKAKEKGNDGKKSQDKDEKEKDKDGTKKKSQDREEKEDPKIEQGGAEMDLGDDKEEKKEKDKDGTKKKKKSQDKEEKEDPKIEQSVAKMDLRDDKEEKKEKAVDGFSFDFENADQIPWCFQCDGPQQSCKHNGSGSGSNGPAPVIAAGDAKAAAPDGKDQALDAKAAAPHDDDDVAGDQVRRMRIRIESKDDGGTLVIVPRDVMKQWVLQIKAHTDLVVATPGKEKEGNPDVILYYGNPKKRQKINVSKAKMVITTYNMVQADRKNRIRNLFQRVWHRIVLDEGHKIRNSKSQTAKAVYKLQGTHRWAMTATPFNNKPDDCAAICRFVGGKHMAQAKSQWWKTARPLDIARWRRNILIRRTIEATGLQLPAIHRVTRNVKLTPRYRAMYDSMEKHAEASFKDFLRAGADDVLYQASVVLVRLRRLMQIVFHALPVWGRRATLPLAKKSAMAGTEEEACHYCGKHKELHPLVKRNEPPCGHYVCRDCRSRGKNDCVICTLLKMGDLTTDHSPKTEALLNDIHEMIRKDGRGVVFAEQAAFLDVVEHYLDEAHIPYLRLDGDMKHVQDRNDVVAKFQAGEVPVLLATLHVAGVGIELTKANTVFLLDKPYNPQIIKQAIARVWRLGQEQEVTIYEYTADATIEIMMSVIQELKINQDKYIMEGSVTPEAMKSMMQKKKRVVRELIDTYIDVRKAAA